MKKEELNKELNDLKEVLDSDLDPYAKFLTNTETIKNIYENFKETIKDITLLLSDIVYFIDILDFGRLAYDCDEYPSMRYLDSIEKFIDWVYRKIDLGMYDKDRK